MFPRHNLTLISMTFIIWKILRNRLLKTEKPKKYPYYTLLLSLSACRIICLRKWLLWLVIKITGLQEIQICCTAKRIKRHFDTDPVLYSAMCPMACCCLCLYVAEQNYVIHNPCIIPLHNIIVPTHAQRYTGLTLYAKYMDKCFSQIYGHLQECKIQSLDNLKL